MTILIHIIIALSSIVCTTYAFFSPPKTKLRTSYTLAGLTVASGTYLVVSQPTHIVQTCIEGLAYIAVVTTGLMAAHYRLARAESVLDI